jgi:hypothetical protein
MNHLRGNLCDFRIQVISEDCSPLMFASEYRRRCLHVATATSELARSKIQQKNILDGDIVLRRDRGQFCQYCQCERSKWSFLNHLNVDRFHRETCLGVVIGRKMECHCEPCHVCLDEVCSSCNGSVLFLSNPFRRATLANNTSPVLKYRLGNGGELVVAHICHPVGSIETDLQLRSRLVDGKSLNTAFLASAQPGQKAEMLLSAGYRRRAAWESIQANRRRHDDALLSSQDHQLARRLDRREQQSRTRFVNARAARRQRELAGHGCGPHCWLL